MAVVQDAFTPTFHRVPFLKPPDMQRMFTPIPRSIVTYVVRGGALSAKPINDQQTAQYVVTHPVEFAYRLIESYVSITQDVAQDWEDGGLVIVNGSRGTPLGTQVWYAMTGSPALSFSPVTERQFWHLRDRPTGVIQSLAKDVSPVVDFRIVNRTTPAAAAGFYNATSTWFEYDIEQVQMFPPLVPSLTYSLNN